jgi:addiction module toxin, txe/yoeB family
MKLLWNEKTFEYYMSLVNEDIKHLKRINKLLKDLQRNGKNATMGKIEKLKHESYYSLRINEKDRITFNIKDGYIEILGIKDHYGDH